MSAFTYPLSLPSISHVRECAWDPVTIVGATSSVWTGQPQTFVWPGQWWQVEFSLIPLKDPNVGLWSAFLLKLNGQEGQFLFGDPARKLSLGNPSGSWTVGASAAANSTVLPIAGGSGMFAVGDWIQIGTYLHQVTHLVDATHVQVFPRLRSAYANGTAIIYSNAMGVFQLATNSMPWSKDVAKIGAFTIKAREYIA